LYTGEGDHMTLSLLLSILLLQGIAPAQAGIVAGTLRGSDGKPAARVRVGVMAIPGLGRGVTGAGTLVSQGQSDDTGRFQMEDVPPGHYYIVAGSLNAPTFYPGVPHIGAAKTIQVPATAGVRDIDFEVVVMSTPVTASAGPSLPVVRVAGRIILKSPNAPMPSSITLQSFPPALTSNLPGMEPGVRVTPAALAAATINLPVRAPAAVLTLPVAQDGKFSADLVVAEQHLAVVGLPTGYSVASVTSGGTNLLSQPIHVKPGVEIVVSLNVGDIRPRYRLLALVREDSTHRLLTGETVELVHSSGEIERLVVNAQGMVTFPGLLQGAYVLRLASTVFEVPEKQVVLSDGSVQVELRAGKKR
jgi:hypothetical protein